MKSEQEIIHMIIRATIKKFNVMNAKGYKTSKELQENVIDLDKEINILLKVFN